MISDLRFNSLKIEAAKTLPFQTTATNFRQLTNHILDFVIGIEGRIVIILLSRVLVRSQYIQNLDKLVGCVRCTAYERFNGWRSDFCL